ncbi:MAG: carbohydrate-binding family 9-like protein [Myxococcales bacterium]|nr:carbohydrate-binding family 9-like protein [Myxococcales bacterium]
MGALVGGLLGCGDDVAALAESPPEPTIWGEGEAVVGDLEFAEGVRVGARGVTPARIEPGTTVTVRSSLTGLPGDVEAWVGLRAPRVAGRQEVAGQSRQLTAPRADPRDRWARAEVVDGVMTASVVVPEEWHAAQAVVVLELRRGDSRLIARGGPRLDRGAGVLAVLAITTRPTRVVARRISGVVIDGVIDEAGWGERAAYGLGQSLDGEPDPSATAIDLRALGDEALAPGRGTTLRLGWDEAALYVAASLPDEDLWSDYRAQDDPLYRQEAFEVFVAASGAGTRYLEYQVSARGVTFDARFPKYRAGDEGWDSRWQTAVAVAGTVGAAVDRDRGWSTELAIPWDEICAETGLVCPPAPGMRLRINAFRLERPDRKRTEALALSPTRAPDFHAWGNAAELELQ